LTHHFCSIMPLFVKYKMKITWAWFNKTFYVRNIRKSVITCAVFYHAKNFINFKRESGFRIFVNCERKKFYNIEPKSFPKKYIATWKKLIEEIFYRFWGMIKRRLFELNKRHWKSFSLPYYKTFLNAHLHLPKKHANSQQDFAFSMFKIFLSLIKWGI